SGDTRPPGEITFQRHIHTPDGQRDVEEVSVQSLLDEAKELDQHAVHCEGCKANVFREPFGCYGRISYPIRAATEEWLLSRLPADLDSPAGQLLRRAVTDFQYDGGPFLRMRPDDVFFERHQPVRRIWETARGAWEITSDQVLEMLFGVGNLQPAHCLMLSW